MMGALNRSGIPAFYDVNRESAMQHGQKVRGYQANKNFWEVGEQKYMNFGFSRNIPDGMCCKIALKGLCLLSGGIKHKIIIMKRDPKEIRKSCILAFPDQDFDRNYPNWFDYYPFLLRETKEILNARNDCEYIEIDFNQLVNNPIKTFKEISAFVPIDPHEAVKEIDLGMVRHSA